MQDRKYLPDPGRKRTWWIQCKQVKGSHLTRSTHLLGPTYSCGTKPPCCTLQVFRNYEVICVTCQAHGFSGGVNKLTMQLKDFANAKSYARRVAIILESKGCNGTDKPKSSHHSKSKQFPLLVFIQCIFYFPVWWFCKRNK